MRLLFVSSEIFPMAKTGGLGDVSASLPAALAAQGADIRLVMPAYPSALRAVVDAQPAVNLARFDGLGQAGVIEARTPDSSLKIWLIVCPALYDRPGGPYRDDSGREWPDNLERFAMLSRAAAVLAGDASPFDWPPDVLHANDWHAWLTAALLLSEASRPNVVFTVHNMAFQGLFPLERFASCGLPDNMRSADGIGFRGGFSLLKAGLQYADWVTTVSPTYAYEIQTPAFGFGLDGLLAGRSESVSGILNGVDYSVWNPSRDPHIAARYDASDFSGKTTCKTALLAAFGLSGGADAPLFGAVGRLTQQKGLDLVPVALEGAIAAGARLVVLGTGDPQIERAVGDLAHRHPALVGLRVEYNEPLAHAIEAGADIFLMPSRFEPCGLSQMYSLRYGTPPVVRSVGGLADTVVDANVKTLRAGSATGVVFRQPSAAALGSAVGRALALFAQPQAWRRIQLTGMQRDFGWARSARQYLDLYRSL